MKIFAIAVLLVTVFSLSAFAATPVCKDINTGAVIECPADSTVMPWDETIKVREMTDKDFEYLVFVVGTIAIVVFTAPVF